MRLIAPLTIGLVVVGLFGSPTALAALGDRVTALQRDRKALGATRQRTQSFAGYTVHELDSDSLKVKEFASSDGIVFGITWQGMAQPDLSPLLGSHLGEYEKAMKRSRHLRGRAAHFAVRTPGLVVEKYGHMRFMGGRAYLPSQLPPGINSNQIR